MKSRSQKGGSDHCDNVSDGQSRLYTRLEQTDDQQRGLHDRANYLRLLSGAEWARVLAGGIANGVLHAHV